MRTVDPVDERSEPPEGKKRVGFLSNFGLDAAVAAVLGSGVLYVVGAAWIRGHQAQLGLYRATLDLPPAEHVRLGFLSSIAMIGAALFLQSWARGAIVTKREAFRRSALLFVVLISLLFEAGALGSFASLRLWNAFERFGVVVFLLLLIVGATRAAVKCNPITFSIRGPRNQLLLAALILMGLMSHATLGGHGDAIRIRHGEASLVTFHFKDSAGDAFRAFDGMPLRLVSMNSHSYVVMDPESADKEPVRLLVVPVDAIEYAKIEG